MIVGRDVSQLDESGISRAAIESLAENFSDGVVAPAFWYVIFGLPGILFYKAVNTADSMIGHHNERYEFFGKPAAKLDDWMNWPAARSSSLFVSAGCFDWPWYGACKARVASDYSGRPVASVAQCRDGRRPVLQQPLGWP